MKFNKSTLNALDKAYTLLDCQLHLKLKNIKAEIETMHETDETTTTLIIASVALGLAGINNIIAITVGGCYFKIYRSKLKRPKHLPDVA